MTETTKLHKELMKIKRNGHYYVSDILKFILADRERIATQKCYAELPKREREEGKT